VNVTTFAAGIINGGTISAHHGIIVVDDSAFFGPIVNTGVISASEEPGIVILRVAVFGNSSTGGIVNRGTISALGRGIDVFSVSHFIGGITNTGAIAAGRAGIQVGSQTTSAYPVSSFDGSIVNSGRITAKTGIAVVDSTISGAIVDSGSIAATSRGILIGSAGEILAAKTAIDIAGGVFKGGISNFGVISGSAGIEIKTAHPVGIFDAGVILAAAGGTAIGFAGGGNTLTLAAGYSIGGTVDPSGNNTLQLGGTGPDTFDLSSIGSGAQYRECGRRYQ
jgi:hypothetical protein